MTIEIRITCNVDNNANKYSMLIGSQVFGPVDSIFSLLPNIPSADYRLTIVVEGNDKNLTDLIKFLNEEISKSMFLKQFEFIATETNLATQKALSLGQALAARNRLIKYYHCEAEVMAANNPWQGLMAHMVNKGNIVVQSIDSIGSGGPGMAEVFQPVCSYGGISCVGAELVTSKHLEQQVKAESNFINEKSSELPVKPALEAQCMGEHGLRAFFDYVCHTQHGKNIPSHFAYYTPYKNIDAGIDSGTFFDICNDYNLTPFNALSVCSKEMVFNNGCLLFDKALLKSLSNCLVKNPHLEEVVFIVGSHDNKIKVDDEAFSNFINELQIKGIITSIRVKYNYDYPDKSFKEYQKKLDEVINQNRLINRNKTSIAVAQTIPPLPNKEYWKNPQPQIVRARAQVQYAKTVATQSQITVTTTKSSATQVDINLLHHISRGISLDSLFDENNITTEIVRGLCRKADCSYTYLNPGVLALTLWKRISCYDSGENRCFDQITKDALRQVLLYREHFTSGINPDKLQELGFFVFAHRGKKILCYDSRLVNSQIDDPLALKLTTAKPYEGTVPFETLSINVSSLNPSENKLLRTLVGVLYAYPGQHHLHAHNISTISSFSSDVGICLEALLRNDSLKKILFSHAKLMDLPRSYCEFKTKQMNNPRPSPFLQIKEQNISSALKAFLQGEWQWSYSNRGISSGDEYQLLELLAAALQKNPGKKLQDFFPSNISIDTLILPFELVLTLIAVLGDQKFTDLELTAFQLQVATLHSMLESDSYRNADWRLSIAAYSILRFQGVKGLINFFTQMEHLFSLNLQRFKNLTALIFPSAVGYKAITLHTQDAYQAMTTFCDFSESEYRWVYEFVTVRYEEAGRFGGDLIENLDYIEAINQFKYFFEKVREYCPQLTQLPVPPKASRFANIPLLLDRILTLLKTADDPIYLLNALANQPQTVLDMDGWFYWMTRKKWTVVPEMEIASPPSSINKSNLERDNIGGRDAQPKNAWHIEDEIYYGCIAQYGTHTFTAPVIMKRDFPYAVSINELSILASKKNITWADFKRHAFRFIATQPHRAPIEYYRSRITAVEKQDLSDQEKCRLVFPILLALYNKEAFAESIEPPKKVVSTLSRDLELISASPTSFDKRPGIEVQEVLEPLVQRRQDQYPSMNPERIKARQIRTGLIKNLLFDATLNDECVEKLNKDLEIIHELGITLYKLTNAELQEILQQIKNGQITKFENETLRRDHVLLACLREVYYRTYREKENPNKRIFPNDTQIMATWHSIQVGGHVVSGIEKGQGKTTVCTLQTAMLWFLSNNSEKTGEFLSASAMLVERDWNRVKHFYQFFGAHTALISKDTTDETTYRTDGIYYSDASNLSLFKQEVSRQGISLPKKVNVVIDEGDDALLDNNTEFVLSIAEGDSTNPWGNLYREIYSILNVFTDCLDALSCPKIMHDQNELAIIKGFLPAKNPLDFTPGDKVQALWRYLVRHPDISEQVKATLLHTKEANKPQEEMWEKLDKWIQASRTSRDLLEKRDFTVAENSVAVANNKVVAYSTAIILERKETGNTGMPQPEAAWSDGVHQCVHARQEVKRASDPSNSEMIPFSCFPEYSIVSKQTFATMLDGYMNRKDSGRVLCNTGTVGTRAEIHHINQSRNFQLFEYPSNEENKRVILPIQYHKTKALQRTAVLNVLKQSTHRPVIIQCADINALEDWEKFIKDNLSDLDSSGRILQTFSAKNIKEGDKILGAGGAGGSILVSNICGRGVDITPENQDDGLLTIETSIQTFRGSWQFYGRGARNGMKGEAVAIYNDEETVERFGVSLLSQGQNLEQAIAEFQALIGEGISRDKLLVDMRVGIEDYVQKQIRKCIDLSVASGLERKELLYIQANVAKQLMEAWLEIEKTLLPGDIFEGNFCPLYPLQETQYRVGEFFDQAEKILAETRGQLFAQLAHDSKEESSSKREGIAARKNKLAQNVE